MARITPARQPRAAASRSRPGGGARPAAMGWATRWWKVALLVAAVLLGLPLAHALFGEVVALLGAAVAFGFVLGRWTAPGR